MGTTWKRWSTKRRKLVKEWLEGDVNVYDQYLTGEVYGYNVPIVEESCWGYFGYDHDKSGLIDDAKSNIDYYIKDKLKNKAKQLKGYIKSKVDLIYRKPLTLIA